MTAKSTQQNHGGQRQLDSPRQRVASRASPHSSKLPAGFLPTRLLKSAVAAQVVGLFNDQSRREKLITRRADGLFGPSSVAWRVHGDVTSMLVGGIAALLLQMLHPAVLAGVWDHSKFQTDLHGRLRRTARFIALTTYGGRADAETAIARVRRIHDSVQGLLANGTAYKANDPSLLAWVHVTEAMSFLDAWTRYAEPTISAADQDRYFTEVAQVASALGANPVPQSRAEADDVIELVKPKLLCDKRTRQVAHLVLTEPAPSIMLEPLRMITTQAALELLPAWARRMHGMSEPSLDRWLVRFSTLGLAQTLRWIFR
jgi:uncharacterized protein (DUF2236 family)